MRAALFAAAVCSVASMRLVNEASPDVSPQSGGGDDGKNEEDDHVRARQIGLVNRFRWQLAIPEYLADRFLERRADVLHRKRPKAWCGNSDWRLYLILYLVVDHVTFPPVTGLPVGCPPWVGDRSPDG